MVALGIIQIARDITTSMEVVLELLDAVGTGTLVVTTTTIMVDALPTLDAELGMVRRVTCGTTITLDVPMTQDVILGVVVPVVFTTMITLDVQVTLDVILGMEQIAQHSVIQVALPTQDAPTKVLTALELL